MWIVFPQTLPSFSCFVSRVYYHGLIHGVRMLAIQKCEFQPCLDSCNPSTCSPTGNPSVSVRIAFAELEHTHTHTDIADCHSRHVTSRSGGQFRFVSIVCLDMKSRSCQPENCRDVPGVSVSVGLN